LTDCAYLCAGILQGSRLSPILYAFYDANVVQGRINKSEGSTGFIDDYNAWVTGTSAVKNTRKLQTQLLYRAEEWARENGAVFEADKTASIHFIRLLRPDQRPPSHQVFGSKTAAPKRSVKILGFTLDSGLSTKLTCVEGCGKGSRQVHDVQGGHQSTNEQSGYEISRLLTSVGL
jgi:hypothetical protein